jgi:sec-independent protein translocase protein TatC
MGDEVPDEERSSSAESTGSDGSERPSDASEPADETTPEAGMETETETEAEAPAEEAVDTSSYGADLTDEDVENLEKEWDPREPYEGVDYDAVADMSTATDDAAATDADDAKEPDMGEPDAAGPEADDTDADTDGSDDGPDPESNLYKTPGQAKSDGGYADGTGTAGSELEPPDPEEYDEFEFEGPPDDQEMPLADHIEEMVKRLGVVIVVMAAVSGVVFPFGADIINFLWYSVIVSNPVPAPRVYAPLALVLARLKVATLAGFIVGLPVFVYQTYLFMRPGLYPKERRYYLASVPTSLVLASIGVLFAYFLVLPALFTYFLYYSEGVTVIAFGLTETFDLMVLMLGWFALIFQIPLFVMLATMMGLVSRVWLVQRRLYFWGAFLGIAFLFAPDPTGMAPIIVAATMVALFEGTLFLQKWSRRGWDAVFSRGA